MRGDVSTEFTTNHDIDNLTCRDVDIIRFAMNDGITLEELSERTGVEPRTLRSWISEGLLSPPSKSGRGATYPKTNVGRAKAVLTLKNAYGMTLADIGRRFMTATEEQIEEWAEELLTTPRSRGSGREYLRNIDTQREVPLAYKMAPMPRARSEGRHSEERRELFGDKKPRFSERREAKRLEREESLASIEQLIVSLEELFEGPAPRRARGMIWNRISITPDLELSIRGKLEPRERALFEQLADQLRAILIGGKKRD